LTTFALPQWQLEFAGVCDIIKKISQIIKKATGVSPVAFLNYWELYLIARPFSKTNKGAPCYYAGASFEIIHLLRVGFNLSFDLI
jgi:hypothetical protein